MTASRIGTVAELFAGVGGFRLALEGYDGVPSTGWRVIWSNQWEPQTRKQDASDCYVARFGPQGHVNDDIAAVLHAAELGEVELPDVDLLVGGFPCQDYSVARVLSQAAGLEGKKGVLWWEIYKFLRLKAPRFIFLENVDRLLKSPADQRGRDFGVMLRCLSDLGYLVEWRVVNAADYGFAQRRRRTFIVGELVGARHPFSDARAYILQEGAVARALPVDADNVAQQTYLGMGTPPDCLLPTDLVELSEQFVYEFQNAGVAYQGRVWTIRVKPRYEGPRTLLRDILVDETEVPSEYFIRDAQLSQWAYLKGAKRESRVAKSGFQYFYTEGALPFPDPIDLPSRTILTGEGGPSPSRFKHVVAASNGRFRRLVPKELERLDGLPDDWTATGMSDKRRAFCVGNALVVGLVHRMARELAVHAGLSVGPGKQRSANAGATGARSRR